MTASSTRRPGLALAALSVATFCYVTVEVLPIGLLTVIAADLHKSRSQTGLLVTGYAVVVIIASIPLARVTQRVPRRLVLGVTLGVLVLATLASAAAHSYSVLLAARLVTALTQAMFWSVVASTATGMFPAAVHGRVVSRLSMGNSLAPVLGVPASASVLCPRRCRPARCRSPRATPTWRRPRSARPSTSASRPARCSAACSSPTWAPAALPSPAACSPRPPSSSCSATCGWRAARPRPTPE